MPRLTTINETRSPAAPLVSYETGKLDWKTTLILCGTGFGLVLIGLAIFLPITITLWPDPYTTTMSGYRTGGLFGSSLVLTLFIGVGVYICLLPLVRDKAYAWRQRVAFEQDLASRAAGNDVVVETEATAYDFDADSFLHMLALTVMIWMLSRSPRQDAPWSVRKMQGPLMIGRVGTMLQITEYQARDARRLLEAVGIIDTGGIEKSAGRLVPQTLEDAVRQLSDKWNRIPLNIRDEERD